MLPACPSLFPHLRSAALNRNRILADPDPSKMGIDSQAYFEVQILHMGVEEANGLGRRTKAPSLALAHVAVGWASRAYPPFALVGLEDFSLALHSDGCVRSSRGLPGQEAMVYPPGLQEDDIVGAGYERNDDVVTFFFTVNGERLKVLPYGWGTFPLKSAMRCVLAHTHAARASPHALA